MSLKNLVTPPGIDPGTVRLIAQRLNHYATPGPGVAQRVPGGGEVVSLTHRPPLPPENIPCTHFH